MVSYWVEEKVEELVAALWVEMQVEEKLVGM
jgi:hypothetical protein